MKYVLEGYLEKCLSLITFNDCGVDVYHSLLEYIMDAEAE